jgi:hypothetical protein
LIRIELLLGRCGGHTVLIICKPLLAAFLFWRE